MSSMIDMTLHAPKTNTILKANSDRNPQLEGGELWAKALGIEKEGATRFSKHGYGNG